MKDLIYLDYNATTPTAPAVVEAMLPWFHDQPGNASSIHSAGRQAAAAVHRARQQVAEAIGAAPGEVVFTSGATEANNIVLRGVHGRVAVVATEHKSVLETARDLGPDRCFISPVLSDGRVDLAALAKGARGADLISVMWGNNETGLVHDLGPIVELAGDLACLVHTDATQVLGKLPVDVRSVGVDFASFSAHKAYGPKGVGALYMRSGVQLRSVMTGGGHERGVRAGTLNVPGIVGFGAAVLLPGFESAALLRQLCGRLLEQLEARCFDFEVLSAHEAGLPNTLCVRFIGADGEALMAQTPGVAMSVGSACTAAVPEPSHVLTAMGISPAAAFETVRLSLGRETTGAEIDAAARLISAAVERVRTLTDCSRPMVWTGGS